MNPTVKHYRVIWINILTGRIQSTKVRVTDDCVKPADFPRVIAAHKNLSDESIVTVLEWEELS